MAEPTTTERDPHFWAVVPAGGAGTRLWPVSRRNHPKFLLDLTGTGRSLLQGTVDRLNPLCGQQLIVVTGRNHSPAVRAQLPELPGAHVVSEPSPRDSMAAIGLAAAIIERRDPEAVIGSFAADHVIGEEENFRATVREAIATARHGYLVTIGIEPTYPATGFGYIKQGSPLGLEQAPRACAVEEFVEKPDAATAAAYLSLGTFRWNAGMFVVRASVLLDLLAENHPDLAAALRSLAADMLSIDQTWAQLEKIAIDHAVAEPAAAAGRVAVVPGDFSWDDIGDFDSLAGLLPSAGEEDDRADVAVLGDPEQVHVRRASGVVVSETPRQIVLLGLSDVVVIDTDDVVLVTTRRQAQDVKSIVELMRSRGHDNLT